MTTTTSKVVADIMATTRSNSIKDNARIFLTDYASYNNGTQFEFGHWVDLSQFDTADELGEYISNHFEEADRKSPLDSPREEIMITDYEGFPEELYSESMSFDTLFEFFERAENSHYDIEVIEAYAEIGAYKLSDVDAFFDALEEAYQGGYKSDEDFAEETAEQLGLINENASWPHSCIDWERAAHELMYDYYESNGHYFRQI